MVSLDDGADFAGRGALLGLKAMAPERLLTPLKALERGVLRPHYPVLHGGTAVGTLASGGYSPTLGTSIAMAYLPSELAAEGTELSVDVRGRPVAAVVTPRPFYRRQEAS